MLTQERLKQLFHYDPKTGLFTRLVAINKGRGVRSRVGDIAGCLDKSSGYIVITVDYINYGAHRIAWLYMTGEVAPEHIDHQNGDRAANWFANLRAVTASVNAQNQRKATKKSATGLLGVVTTKAAGKIYFHARLVVGGKRHYLGSFPTALSAHEAYVTAKRALHPGGTI